VLPDKIAYYTKRPSNILQLQMTISFEMEHI